MIKELRNLVGVEYGHVMKKNDEDWVKTCMEIRVEGRRPRRTRLDAQNDTAYKRWSYDGGYKMQCKLCRNLPPPAMGARFTFLGKAGMRTRWMAGAPPHKSGPTTTHKQVWICDICHNQIHGRKQISIRCNKIDHWLHLRCTGIRLAQYLFYG